MTVANDQILENTQPASGRYVNEAGETVNVADVLATSLPVTNEGASKIASIAISAVSQATAAIPETRVIVHNASSAIIFIEAGAGAVAVAGTSQPLASGASAEVSKSADSEIAVIGTAAAGNVYFSPQVANYA